MRLCGTRSTVAAHGGASPPRSVSSHLNNFFDLHDNSLLSEDPEGNMVRSLHFTHLSRIHQKCLEVSRAAHKTWFRPDAHDDAPRAPCRTRAKDKRSVQLTVVAAAAGGAGKVRSCACGLRTKGRGSTGRSGGRAGGGSERGGEGRSPTQNQRS